MIAVTADETLGTFLKRLGVPAKRVRMRPAPGTATEADCVAANHRGVLCELIDATLVEKPVGTPESAFANLVAFLLTGYTLPTRSGVVCVADGIFRMKNGNLRLPDVSFTLRARLPNPLPQIGGWCPDLCVEVLSASNTGREMAVKRADFFASGAKTVWEIHPKRRTAKVYSAPDLFVECGERDHMTAESVLPGYRLSLRDLYKDFDDLLTRS